RSTHTRREADHEIFRGGGSHGGAGPGDGDGRRTPGRSRSADDDGAGRRQGNRGQRRGRGGGGAGPGLPQLRGRDLRDHVAGGRAPERRADGPGDRRPGGRGNPARGHRDPQFFGVPRVRDRGPGG